MAVGQPGRATGVQRFVEAKRIAREKGACSNVRGTTHPDRIVRIALLEHDPHRATDRRQVGCRSRWLAGCGPGAPTDDALHKNLEAAPIRWIVPGEDRGAIDTVIV